MNHVAYYLATGEITKYMRLIQQNIEINAAPGESYQILDLPIIDVAAVYMNAGAVTYKPVMDLSVSGFEMTTEDELTISGIPEGATVHYPGGSAVVNDGTVEWQSAVSGIFIFVIELFPFLTERLEIEVTEV